MGFVDADTHVFETETTWSYLSQKEQHLAPMPLVTAWGAERRVWFVDGVRIPRGAANWEEKPPSGAVRTLEDVPGRIAWMDKLGVETQVIISSFFLGAVLKRTEQETALARAYNRWMADVWAESKGRLRWTLIPPTLDLDATREEIEFGAKHGAVGVLVRGLEHDRHLGDPYFDPMYAAAQDANLAIACHIGNIYTNVYNNTGNTVFHVIANIAGFYQVINYKVPEKFPNLRFGFLEAGAEWIPFALRELSRGSQAGAREEKEMQLAELMQDKQIYVACQMDEDIPHILKFAGEDHIVFGTDFGHNDIGSDLEGHRMLMERTDVAPEVLRKIVDGNGRALYDLPATAPASASLAGATA
jgi:hypothetical protein